MSNFVVSFSHSTLEKLHLQPKMLKNLLILHENILCDV